MNVKELRIGNYVQRNGKIGIVKGITMRDGVRLSFLDGDSIICSHLSCQGVPLSEEILSNIGFIKKGKTNRYYIYDTALVLSEDWREQPSFHIGIEYTDSPFERDENTIYNYGHKVQFVHQLQNIYDSIFMSDGDLYDELKFKF